MILIYTLLCSLISHFSEVKLISTTLTQITKYSGPFMFFILCDFHFMSVVYVLINVHTHRHLGSTITSYPKCISWCTILNRQIYRSLTSEENENQVFDRSFT